jgi:hypothetical protein
VADIFTMPRRKPDRRTRVALRVEEWPKEDRSRWVAAFVPGDIFDGAGAGAHLSPASQTGMVYAYGRWLGFLSRSDPDSLSHLPEDRVTRERLVRFCELLAETNSAVSIASALSHSGKRCAFSHQRLIGVGCTPSRSGSSSKRYRVRSVLANRNRTNSEHLDVS